MIDNSFFSSFFLKEKNKQLLCEEPIYAYIVYKEFRINLLTGERETYSAVEFLNLLELYKLNKDYKEPIVLHLFFEFGYLCCDNIKLIDSTKPLGIIIKYKKSAIVDLFQEKQENKFSLDLLSTPGFDEYEEKFNRVYEELLEGNCYQVNLTMPFYFRMKNEYGPREFMTQLWRDNEKVGPFAHGTYIPALDKLLVSNSPECLFQISKESDKLKLTSMPIKGTEEISESGRDAAIKKLFASQKNQAELYMISDLVRNDLAKIEFKPATIEAKKISLTVPGLVHQYSLISVELEKECSLKKIVHALFPGGSITGAPKKKVMEIIKELEDSPRGFYCGSTILFSDELKSASINIRSVEVDYADNEIKYGAGGGVTLLSSAREEYDEMVAKMKSFLLLLSE